MKSRVLALLTSIWLVFGASAQTPPAPAPAETPRPWDASAAIEKKNNAAFLKFHQQFLARAKSGPIGLLFLGDSITAGWIKAPHIWEAYYGKYDPANFGIGGDTTQNVIWRIENGELDGIHPKVVVLMLGTNNTANNTAPEILAADTKIVKMIRERIPGTKVLLLAIFPRGDRRGTNGSMDLGAPRMAIIRVVNLGLARLDDGVNIRFLDIGNVFLGQDGKIPYTLMPDQLHPNAAGYQLWSDEMKPLLDQMMK